MSLRSYYDITLLIKCFGGSNNRTQFHKWSNFNTTNAKNRLLPNPKRCFTFLLAWMPSLVNFHWFCVVKIYFCMFCCARLGCNMGEKESSLISDHFVRSKKTSTPTALYQLSVYGESVTSSYLICFFLARCVFVFFVSVVDFVTADIRFFCFFLPVRKLIPLHKKLSWNNRMSMRPNEQNKRHDYGAWHGKCFAVPTMSDCIAHMFAKIQTAATRSTKISLASPPSPRPHPRPPQSICRRMVWANNFCLLNI